MEGQQEHKIIKQHFDITIHGETDRFRLQNQVSRIFWHEIKPAIEKMMDEFCDKDHVICIDKLEIDLGTTPVDNLKEVFIENFSKTLKNLIAENYKTSTNTNHYQTKNNDNNITVLSSNQHIFNQWLYFLKTGSFPKNIVPAPEDALENRILESLVVEIKAPDKLENQLKNDPASMDRLIMQHSESFLKSLIDIYSGNNNDPILISIHEIVTVIEELNKSDLKDLLTNYHLFRKRKIQVKYFFWHNIISQIIINHQLVSDPDEIFCDYLVKYIPEKLQTSIPALVQEKFLKTDSFSSATIKAKIKKLGYILNEKNSARGINIIPLKADPRIKDKDHTEDMIHEGLLPESSVKQTSPQEPEYSQKQDPAGEKQTTTDQKETSETPEGTTIKEDFDIIQESINISGSSSPEIKSSEDRDVLKKPDTIADTEINFTKKKTNDIVSAIIPPEEIKSKDSINNIPDLPEGNEYYINNAGMILLHPFLAAFFSEFNLIEQQNFIDEYARQRAIHLLHYLATGEEQLPEYRLLLPKLLCNMPFAVPMNREIIIYGKEKEESHKLLKAVIDHWGALGNTSADGLREGFLVRDGKLVKRQIGWTLLIESNSIDILLSKLPWGISMIKLPWMPDILNVEWT